MDCNAVASCSARPVRRSRMLQGDVVQGDVVHWLNALPIDQPFDVVIADPPYNIGKDFGETKDSLPLAEYVDWTMAWLSRAIDLLAPNGIAYVYGFPEILAHIAVQFPLEQQRWLAWHYTNKTVAASKFWQRSYESILCLWRNGRKKPDLEIDQLREPYTPGVLKADGKKRAGTKSRFGSGKETTYRLHRNGALPRDILKVPALAGGAGNRERWFWCEDCGDAFPPKESRQHHDHETWKHATQKPMRLTKKLLMSRINGTSGRLLVPFAGSGSECVVAKLMAIPFVGVEINPHYVGFAQAWLRKTKRGAMECGS